MQHFFFIVLLKYRVAINYGVCVFLGRGADPCKFAKLYNATSFWAVLRNKMEKIFVTIIQNR